MFCKSFEEVTTSAIACLPSADSFEPSNGNNKPAARLCFSVTRTVFCSTGAATGATGAGAPKVNCAPKYRLPKSARSPFSF